MNENKIGTQLQDSQRTEPGATLGGADAGKKEGPTRPIVRIVSHRTRLLDRDNLYRGAKALLDALRYTGAVRDDSESAIDYEAAQVKVAHRDQEKTVVELDLP